MAVFLNKCHLTACSSAEVACVAGGIVWVQLKFWPRSRVPKKESKDEAVEILRRSWRLRHQISLDYYTIPPATQATAEALSRQQSFKVQYFLAQFLQFSVGIR